MSFLKKIFTKEDSDIVDRPISLNSHHWIAKNFKLKKQMFSEKFTLTTGEQNPHTNWRLGVYTDGTKSMTLQVTNFDDLDLSVELSIVIKNSQNKIVCQKQVGQQKFADKYRSQIYETKIKCDDSAENNNDKLRDLDIVFQISINEFTATNPEDDHDDDDVGFIVDKASTDVIFKLNGHSYYAHQCVLTRQSAFFKKVLIDKSNPSIFEVREVSTEVFIEFLRFLYTGEVFNLDNLASQLSSTADKYGVIELEETCQKCILKNFMMRNPHVYDFELTYNDSKTVPSKVWKWMVKYSKDFLNEPQMERVFAEAEPLLACEMYANRCVHVLQMNNVYNLY